MEKNTKKPDVILVKYTFTNKNRIPVGIHEKTREYLTNFRLKEIERGIKTPGAYNKHRSNRVDTGCPQKIKNVSLKLSMFIEELQKKGYRLTDCHYFCKRRNGQKITVVTTYSCTVATVIEFPQKTIEGIDRLVASFWKFCYLWQNPPEHGKTVWTVNLMHHISEKDALKPLSEIQPLSFKKWLLDN